MRIRIFQFISSYHQDNQIKCQVSKQRPPATSCWDSVPSVYYRSNHSSEMKADLYFINNVLIIREKVICNFSFKCSLVFI